MTCASMLPFTNAGVHDLHVYTWEQKFTHLALNFVPAWEGILEHSHRAWVVILQCTQRSASAEAA